MTEKEFRKSIYWKFKDDLEDIAEEIGLVSGLSMTQQERFKEGGDKYQFLLMEAYTRNAMERAYALLGIDLHQRGQYSQFDVDFISGGTLAVSEGKTKLCHYQDYPTFKMSKNKWATKDDMSGQLFVKYYGGYFFIWDLDTYKPFESKDWEHQKYTAGTDDEETSEDAWEFEYDKAMVRGNIVTEEIYGA